MLHCETWIFLKKLVYTSNLPLATNQSVTHPTIPIKTALLLCQQENIKGVCTFAFCLLYFTTSFYLLPIMEERGKPLPPHSQCFKKPWKFGTARFNCVLWKIKKIKGDQKKKREREESWSVPVDSEAELRRGGTPSGSTRQGQGWGLLPGTPKESCQLKSEPWL